MKTANLLAGVWLLGGCTTTVIVPPAQPRQPTPVFVLDHGRHSSLVLPHPDGLVRYAYGDWAWYALQETGPARGSSALLWSSRAGLGRRVLPGPATAAGVRRSVRVGIEHVHALLVETARVAALRAELDVLFFDNAATRHFNATYDLAFVHHPQRYSALRNSNHAVARWLERLGCRIDGSAFWAQWQVVSPPTQAARVAFRHTIPARSITQKTRSEGE